jgi:hypothetical protein
MFNQARQLPVEAMFKKSFATRSGASLASSASAEALDEEEVQQEKIVKQKRKK